MSKPIPYEAIRKKNLANIMAKLQAGKTLTTAESKIIDADKREAEGLRPDKTDDELAEEFGCSRMSIHRAKKLGVRFDVDDATTYADCKKYRVLLKWCKRYENENGIKSKVYQAAETKTPEQLRDEYLAELQVAKSEGNEEREKVALNAYLKIDKQIRDTLLDEKKLGIKEGEMLPREEVERIMKAVIYAGNACVRNQMKEICQVLASESNPNAIYQKLAPAILGGRLFEGFKAVMKSPSKVQLPEWIVDVMQSEGENYLKGVDLK
jgi:hypothetical protein